MASLDLSAQAYVDESNEAIRAHNAVVQAKIDAIESSSAYGVWRDSKIRQGVGPDSPELNASNFVTETNIAVRQQMYQGELDFALDTLGPSTGNAELANYLVENNYDGWLANEAAAGRIHENPVGTFVAETYARDLDESGVNEWIAAEARFGRTYDDPLEAYAGHIDQQNAEYRAQLNRLGFNQWQEQMTGSGVFFENPEEVFLAQLDKDAEIRQGIYQRCLLYTSPSPRDRTRSRMPSSA